MPTLRTATVLPVSAAEAFAWHERPGALQRLTPPWAAMDVIQAPDGLQVGTKVILAAGIGPIRPRWVAEHVTYDPPHEFRDIQRSGPFAVWDHRHRFIPVDDDHCELVDEVTYRLPLAALSAPLLGRIAHHRLGRMFAFRHARTAADLAAHAAAKEQPRMKIAITGASGLIGSNLAAFLTTGGHTVVPMVRRPANAGEVRWDPAAGTVDTDGLQGVDAVVHLAADAIKPRPLTDAKARSLRDSRVNGTRTIAQALASMSGGPRILVSASGANFYGDRGDEILTEDSPAGEDELFAAMTREWESATQPAADAGIRTVCLRTGIVLERQATIIKALGLATRLGAAAPVGSGRQYWPWVSIDDTVGLYHHALTNAEISGPLNACSPNPVTNEEFTRTLARVLRRPVLPLKIPRFAPAMLLGRKQAASLLFTSMRVMPHKAQQTGYTFRSPQLEPTLRELFGR
jgi:uncharacterized protein